MKANFHTHTQRCFHAFGTEEDYVKAAVSAGLSQLGFSDHAPFPDTDFGYRMPFSELDDYLAAIDSLKESYPLRLFKGLEIEYLPTYRDYYQTLLGRLDYLALGEHFYLMPDGERRTIFSAKSTQDYLDYACAVCEAIQTGWFAFVAHPDVMMINGFAWDNNCQKAAEMMIACAAEQNMVLEFNANGYRREPLTYPDRRFWEMVSDTNIRVIVGSDCHTPEQVWDSSMETALHAAKAMGLNVIDTIFEGENAR